MAETANPTNVRETLKKLKVPIGGLNHYERNPRRGDLTMIMESLEAHGQYKPVVVRTGTNEILAGNHTVMAATELGWDSVAATFVDVDDDEAARIVLVDNRTNDVAGYDDAELLGLLQSVKDTDLGLTGTGFTEEDVRDLLEDPYDEDLAGMDGGDDGKGEALELWGVTYGEPDIDPEPGTVWQLGPHVLVVADVHKHWDHWIGYLTKGALLWPYPSLLAPFTDRANDNKLVMVQPSRYLAGWNLTKWNRLREDQAFEITPVREEGAT